MFLDTTCALTQSRANTMVMSTLKEDPSPIMTRSGNILVTHTKNVLRASSSNLSGVSSCKAKKPLIFHMQLIPLLNLMSIAVDRGYIFPQIKS